MGKRDEREEEDRGGLVACNLRPLKTSWETARLLCLNGTGDGMRRTGRNVEGSREDGRETYALPPAQGGGSCFATAARNLEPAWWGWLSEFELLENVSGTPCSKIGWREMVVAILRTRHLDILASPVLWTHSTGCSLITGCPRCRYSGFHSPY